MATIATITRILTELQHLPNCPITDMNIERIVEQYAVDLADIPDDILGAATIHYRTGGNQFFPTSGQLREKATDMYLTAMNVPTPHQAWAQVLSAPRIKQTALCDEGERLFREGERQTGGAYWAALKAYGDHKDSCDECQSGGYQEVYDHPVVAQVVAMLGGRDRILTDNLAADRAQFLKGYADIVMRQTKLATMAEPVKRMVGQIAGEQMKALADGMRR